MFRYFAPLFLAVALSGCGQTTPEPAPEQPPQIAARTAVAAVAGEMALAQLPATVVQPPGARVAVSTPFAGLVRSVHVQPGQAVRQGQLLAIIVSRDAMTLAAELAQAEARRRLTAAEAARMAELARAGIVAGSRADAAAAASSQDDISVRAARAMIDQANVGRDGSIRLTAPIAGRVISMTMDAGAAVDGMSAPIIIEREGSRWLALQIPERLASVVRAGLPVTTEDGQTGRLETVASSLDPATRAFAARARLADGGAPLVGGRLMRLTIRTAAPAGAVSVPAAAIATEDGKDLVFVKTGTGFAARPVTRAGSGDPAVIISGLKAGETVAISNLPELRAVVQR
jgi:cobalt-zinc-cadmium efflux system membrane fusion protein